MLGTIKHVVVVVVVVVVVTVVIVVRRIHRQSVRGSFSLSYGIT